MNAGTRLNVPWPVLVLGAVVFLAAGAGATYVSLRSTAPTSQVIRDDVETSRPRPASMPEPVATPAPPMSGPLPDVVVPLSKEGAARAGVRVAPVTAGGPSAGLRVPAVVEANAYKLIAVTPLIGGRITRVNVALGQLVSSGEILAQIFSPELADSQTRYISARAELDAHERELARTEKLVQIGSASRQELERIHAEHTSRRAGLQSAASRLRLLGLSESAIEALDPGQALDATISVPSPIAGVVTERLANVGLNVEPATRLFTVIDLSSVWVVADVYQKDFSHVRIGAPARVTTSAYPDLAIEGRVSYIDPQVDVASRTAKVRVEVPNVGGHLRLGMLAEILIGKDGDGFPSIPRSAVQNVGDRAVVYLAHPQIQEQFIEREVRLGAAAGDRVSVLAGVRPGDVVVAEGSFSVRAERERLGLRSTATPSALAVAERRPGEAVQTAKITVGEQGYEPSGVSLRAGVPARLTFVRTTDKTCGTEISFPSLNIKRPLPINEPVVIQFTPAKAGELTFTCGMNMLEGTVVIR